MTDAELLEVSTEFRDGILGPRGHPLRMCFAVCAPLRGYLKAMHGFKTELVEGWIKKGKRDCNHYWLKLPDGRVLDPTASQFNDVFKRQMPTVYLGKPTRLHKEEKVHEHAS